MSRLKYDTNYRIEIGGVTVCIPSRAKSAVDTLSWRLFH